MLHELWDDGDELTFCLAGPHGDQARGLLGPSAELVWTVEADSHFQAMTLYYQHMGWGAYTSSHEWDPRAYQENGFE